jgi:branched-chain amino acid transport system permease protein
MTAAIVFQAVLSGAANGAVYALVAVGLTLIFGVMRIINFAHGEFLMLAMYGGYFAWSYMGIDPLLAIFFVAPVFTLVGAIFYRVLVRPLMRAPEINQMAVTLGLSLLLQNLALVVFAGDNRLITLPRSTASVAIGPAFLQMPQLLAAFASIVLLGGLYLLIHRTSLGLSMRAASQSRDGAALSGIQIGRVYLIAVALGIGTLGVAGPLLVSMLYVNPHIGELFTLKAFVIVIVGGLGSFGGALMAALLISMAESIAGVWLPASAAAAIPFVLLILVMLFRPEGILATAGAHR